MDFHPEKIVAALREQEMKITPQRQLILQILHKNTEHPSAEEIFEKVKRRLPNTSFTTIYNTLELLKNLGYIRELRLESDRRRFDPNTDCHHHIYCDECGKIEDVFVVFNDVESYKERQPEGYALRSVEMSFHGLCSQCKPNSKSRRRKN